MGGRVTILDIAKAAGVSRAAVSLALRGAKNISPERSGEIRKIARKLNYRPSVAAQLLRSKQTGYIGVVLAHDVGGVIDSGFATPILAHFVDQCERQGQQYHIGFLCRSPGGDFTPPRHLTGGMLDGVLVAGWGSREFRQWLAEGNRHLWVSLDEPADFSVTSTTDVGIVGAVERLVALGHRRIAFIGGPTQYTQHRLALEGFRQAVQKFELPVDLDRWICLVDEHLPFGQTVNWIQGLLSEASRPTAVICMTIGDARLTTQIARELGLRVPDDLSVIGFGPAGAGLRNWPALSCIEPNYDRMVELGIRMLRNRMSGELIEPSHWTVPTDLVMRATVANASK